MSPLGPTVPPSASTASTQQATSDVDAVEVTVASPQCDAKLARHDPNQPQVGPQ